MTASAVDSSLQLYRRLQRRRLRLVLGLALAATAAFASDLLVGPSELTAREVFRTLLSTAPPGENAFIVWQLRLPQALLAVLLGCALGLAGVEMQAVLGNALADPFTLGVSSAAALGAALAIVLGIGLPALSGPWLVAGNAFVFSFGSLLALLALMRVRIVSAERLILFGIAMGFTFGALLALLQFVASPEALQQLTFWTMGSLVRADWPGVALLGATVAVVLPFSLGTSWRITALGLGEEQAASLGVNLRRLRLWALVRISLLAAVSVSLAGIIGFVGLTGPHIARLIVGNDHRWLAPASALVAMTVMSLAAIGAKAVLPGVIVPIGIVTALVGLPVFFFLLLARRETP